MARFLVRSIENAEIAAEQPVAVGHVETRSYFEGEADPVRVHLHRIVPQGRVRLGPRLTDCLAYVWKGSIEAGSVPLDAGSSLIVEHGATIELRAVEEAMVVSFAAVKPTARQRRGGNVHLLPREQVPRAPSTLGAVTRAALHADGTCPSCEVWLHENELPPADRQLDETWIHSHSEDEAIFVVEGQLRLGNRLYGPGTAVSIAARTFYTFNSGPQGLKYINFRPARPGDMLFKDGRTADEPAMYGDLRPQAHYLKAARS
jgi:hypothetical protein